MDDVDKLIIDLKDSNSEYQNFDEESFVFCLSVISERLKTERLKKGMTQKQLAKSIGTHTQVISRIENNPMNLSLLTFFKLANALGKKVVLDLVEKETLPKR